MIKVSEGSSPRRIEGSVGSHLLDVPDLEIVDSDTVLWRKRLKRTLRIGIGGDSRPFVKVEEDICARG
jgi:hypothetical protein